MKCPQCQTDNPPESKFCMECATPLPSTGEAAFPQTETLKTPLQELSTGSTFAGRYQVIEELGRGGMGSVYKVFDTRIKEKVALKLIKPEVASDRETIERFNNELRLARKVRHKNVCGMFDLGEAEGAYFITMEYVHGEDLKSMIRMSTGLTVGTVLSVGKQVCDGLAEAHSLGVVHRDLKPQNIMIDKGGNAKIMDFGIARSVKEKGITGPSVLIGTPEYMSPEQAEAKEIDHRSDIYSLGIILYEMATGRVPFEGDTALSIAMKHKGEVPKNPKQFNPHIPDDLSGVILKCLEKDRAARYQTAMEVRSELEKIEKGIPTTERVVPERKTLTSREITVKLPLRKLLIPSLAVAAVVVAALILWRLIPKKEAVQAPLIENSIAVITFENRTGDKSYDYLQKVIPDLLITKFEQTGFFYVATWERMRDLLKQMGKGDVGVIDKDLGFELCRREGIKAIVLGFYTKAGEMFVADAKVLDVGTKKLLKSVNSSGEGVESILRTQIDELGGKIARDLGIATAQIEAGQKQIAEVTTASMEAYNYYLRGREEYEKVYYEDARKFLENAVKLDPTFAMAYLYLGWTYGALGEAGAVSEALKKAMAHIDKVTDKERLQIESSYALWVEQDTVKRTRLLEQAAKKYQKEKGIWFGLGISYNSLGNLDKAAEALNKALELDPGYAEAINILGIVFRKKGELEKALELFKKYASLSPGNANPFDSMAHAYFLMGRMDEAIAKFKEALSVKPDFWISLIGLQYISALREDYPEAIRWLDQLISVVTSPGLAVLGYEWKGFHSAWLGREEKAFEELQKAAELAARLKNDLQKALIDLTRAWICYDHDELEVGSKYFKSALDAYSRTDAAMKEFWDIYARFFYGLVDLKQGRLNSAKSKLTDMKSLISRLPGTAASPAWPAFYCRFLEAEIALAERKPKEAILASRSGLSPPHPPSFQNSEDWVFNNFPFLKDLVARAYEQNGEIDESITEYERLVSFDPKSQTYCLTHPIYHYRLARLYDQKGLKAKAIEQYQKFLDLWKDADPGHAEVAEAKKQMLALESR